MPAYSLEFTPIPQIGPLTPTFLTFIRTPLFTIEALAVDHSINRSTIAKDWHTRGFSCGLWIDHAGREWSNPAKDNDELFMLVSGVLELELDDLSIRPSVGKEICIPAGKPYTIRNIGGKTARWLYGQVREAPSDTEALAKERERSFHPELKRKRRPEKRTPVINVSKET